MIFSARPRATVTRMSVPIAGVAGRAQTASLGTRVASSAQDFLSQARTDSVRRIVLWLLLTACVGVLALGYLLQTSHVASLANQRATLEKETARVRDANARLAAQAAGFQTLTRADTTARDQGLQPVTPSKIVYVTLPDVQDAPPATTAAPPRPPGLLQRIGNALTGQASADSVQRVPTVAATPGGHP